MASRRAFASSLLLLAGSAAAGEVAKTGLNATGRIVTDAEDTVVLDDQGSQARNVGVTEVFGLNSTGKVHTGAGKSSYSELEVAADLDESTVQRTKELLQVRARTGFGVHAKGMQNVARTLNRGFVFKPSESNNAGDQPAEDTPEGEDIPEPSKKKVTKEAEKDKGDKGVKDRRSASKTKDGAVENPAKKDDAAVNKPAVEKGPVVKDDNAAKEDDDQTTDDKTPEVVNTKPIVQDSSANTSPGVKKAITEEMAKERQSKIEKLREHAKTLNDWADKLLGNANIKEAKANNQKEVRVKADKLALQSRESLAPILQRFLSNGLLSKSPREYMEECQYVGEQDHSETMAHCADAERMRDEITQLIKKMLGQEARYVAALNMAQDNVVKAAQESLAEPQMPECFEECKAEDDARKAEEDKQEALRKLDELEDQAEELWKKVEAIPMPKNKDGTDDRQAVEWKAVLRFMVEEFIGRRALSEKVNSPQDIEEAFVDLKKKFQRMQDFVMTFTPQTLAPGMVHIRAKVWLKHIVEKVSPRKEKFPQLWTEANRLLLKVQEVLPDDRVANFAELANFLDELQRLLAQLREADSHILGDAGQKASFPHAVDVALKLQDLRDFTHSFYEDACQVMTYKIELAEGAQVKAALPNDKVAGTDSDKSVTLLAVLAKKVKDTAARNHENVDITLEDMDALADCMDAVDKELPFDQKVARKVSAVSNKVYDGEVAGAEDLEKSAADGTRNEVGLSEEDLREKARLLREHAEKLLAEADKMTKDSSYQDQSQIDTLQARASEYSSEADRLFDKAQKNRRLGKFTEAEKLQAEAAAKLSESEAIKSLAADKNMLKGFVGSSLAKKPSATTNDDVEEGSDTFGH